MEEENKPASLPENAYRKLAPGEKYEPLLKPKSLTPRSRPGRSRWAWS